MTGPRPQWWRDLVKGTQCHYCPERATTRDHIVPYALWRKRAVRELLDPCAQSRLRGPWGRESNLVPSCLACNAAKGCEWPTCLCPKCVQAGHLWAEHHVRAWAALGVELSDLAITKSARQLVMAA